MPIPGRHPGQDLVDPPPPPGLLVRHAREAAYLSQQDLADRAGVSRSVVSRLEGGGRPPRWDLVEQLLACLDLQPRVQLEGLDAHLGARLEAEARRPADEWVVDAVTDVGPALRVAHELALAVDGSLAARLHGVAVPLRDIELVVPASCATAALELACDRHWMGLRRVHRDDDGDAGFDEDRDDDHLSDGATWWCERFERRIVLRRAPLPPTVLLHPPEPDGRVLVEGPVLVVAVDCLTLGSDDRRLLSYAMRRRRHEE